MAFRTSDELAAHVDIEHKAKNKVIKANALLAFEFDDKEEEGTYEGRGRGGKGRGGKFVQP